MKTRLLLLAGLAIAFALPTFAQQTNKIITVLPTGSDDTAHLQSGFDKAVAEGPGVTVRLVEGTYKTRQIVANNFRGAFIGAGADKSVLTNLPGLVVKQPINVWANSLPTPWSGTNPWPALVAFVNGDFVVSDMGMSITGAQPTTGWTIFDSPTFYELFIGFEISGTTANAIFLRVGVTGEDVPNSYFGHNLVNGIQFQGASTGPLETAPPISGSFVVRDSKFQSVESATPVVNVSHASILIGHNDSNDVGVGMEVAGLADSSYQFLLNTVNNAFYGAWVYDPIPPLTVAHVASSEILISNNVFSNGQYGVYISATFLGGATCQVVSNNFQNVSNIGIYLGSGTSHCIVAGNSKTTIQNLGTNNVITDKSSAP